MSIEARLATDQEAQVIVNVRDSRDKLKRGNVACARWFDDPHYYVGHVVEGDDGELGMQLPNDCWGTIGGAFHCVTMKQVAK